MRVDAPSPTRPTTWHWRAAWLTGFVALALATAIFLYSYNDKALLTLVGALASVVIAFKHRWVTMLLVTLGAGSAFIGWIWLTSADPLGSAWWFVAAAVAAAAAVLAERRHRRRRSPSH